MQVGEERLALAQHGALGGLRLLHLDDQVGRGEHVRGGGEHRSAGPLVVLVDDALARSRVMLDVHLVAMLDGLAHARGRHADPVLVDLELLRHAYAHHVNLQGGNVSRRNVEVGRRPGNASSQRCSSTRFTS